MWSARNISDWKRSEGNDTVWMHNKYVPDDLAAFWNLARALIAMFGDDVSLQMYKSD